MKFFIVLATVLAVGSAQIALPGQCEDVKLVSDFDIEAYTGLWYETFRYEHVNQLSGDCVTAKYTLEDGVFKVTNAMVLKEILFYIDGTAVTAPDANGEGKLLVTFPNNERPGNYWVLNTDYTSYSLVYACSNVDDDTKKVLSWVLSRTPTLSSEAKASIDATVEAVSALDWENFRPTSQTPEACVYNSNSTVPSHA